MIQARRSTFVRSLAAACLTAVCLAWPGPFVAPAAAQVVSVPMRVNVLANTMPAPTPQDIERMVEEANRILRNYDLRLDFDAGKNLQTGVADGGNNNGAIEQGEAAGLVNKGAEEVRDKLKGRGYKVYIATLIESENLAAGLSFHASGPGATEADRQTIIPVSFLVPGWHSGGTADTRAQRRGNDLAHEFAHAFTLGNSHAINERGEGNATGSHSNRDDNLMGPENPTSTGRPRGGRLSNAQRDEIKKRVQDQARAARGAGQLRAGFAAAPLTKGDAPHDLWTDTLGDMSDAHLDLSFGAIAIRTGSSNLETTLVLAGLHPGATSLNSRFEVLLDTDNSLLTGGVFGSFSGIDKILRTTIGGQYPFTSPSGSTTTVLYDVATATTTPLSSGEVQRIEALVDALDVYDAVIQDVPLSQLGTLASQVPVGVRVTDLDTSATDEASGVFNSVAPPNPLLVSAPLSGRSGSRVTLTGTDFSPSSAVKLLIGDTLVTTVMTASDGSFAASLTFDAMPPATYFLTARDDATGDFDFSILRHLGNGLSSGDYDGDGTADVAVFRPADSAWYLRKSGGGAEAVVWGASGDLPAPGDYDGDGRTDIAVFRPTDGGWYIIRSTAGAIGARWGEPGDLPVPGDYDGDGRTDMAVFRPSTGDWFIARSGGGATALRWGTSGDIPVPADYDGDGRTDVAVYRPDESAWYLIQSTDGARALRWGDFKDLPVAADFDGDGRADIGVFRAQENAWYIIRSTLGAAAITWGEIGDAPLLGDFDGDGTADVAVFREDEGAWYIVSSTGGIGVFVWGARGDLPI